MGLILVQIKYQGITKVIQIHPAGNMNVWTKQGKLFSLKTPIVNLKGVTLRIVMNNKHITSVDHKN